MNDIFGFGMAERALRQSNKSEASSKPRSAAFPRLAAKAGVPMIAALVALTGCASRPPASALDRTPTQAIATTVASPLQQAVAGGKAAHPGESGLHLLTTGTDALDARVAMAEAAAHTLDLQYYIAAEDRTGKLILESTLRAADRGVRVRLLVDGLNFKDIDDLMAVLNTHPKIEVRVFNPFGTASEGLVQRVGSALTHLDELTRRMHNKAMIADNQVSIVGGRNLGDEYFDASPKIDFRDIDVLVAGATTADVSKSFDTFWNSKQAYPLRSLNHQRLDPKQIAATHAALAAHWRAEKHKGPAHDLASRIADGRFSLTWAPAEFWVDSPRKVDTPADSYVSPPMHRLDQLAAHAQKSFFIISPYFAPHDSDIALLGQMSERGVAVKILTNSLAATDAVAVQAGYGPYRVKLLQDHVDLYEFRAIPGHPQPDGVSGSHSKASLHAKAYIIDDQTLVVGSMNYDRRSFGLNTETALVMHSPPLARQVDALFAHATAPAFSYHVTLAPSSGAALSPHLRWEADKDGHPVTYTSDPDAGTWRKFLVTIFRILPMGNQL